MTAEQAYDVIHVLKRWGVRTVTIGGGNPLLSPHIAPFIRSLHAQGIRAGLITEGGVELSTPLVESIGFLEWIRFSLDGPTAEIHDRIRATPGLFASTTQAIRDLRKAETTTKIGLNCVIQRRNIDFLDAMWPTANELDVDVLQFKLPHGDDAAQRYIPTRQEWIQIRDWMERSLKIARGDKPATNLSQLATLLEDVLDLEDVATGRPARTLYAKRKARCFVPLLFLVIDPEGNVFPCDYLQADTRPGSRTYQDMRHKFCAGNVLTDPTSVLENCGTLLRKVVHALPGTGHDECGSCTRFFQLNTLIDDQLTVLDADQMPSAAEGSADSSPFL